MHLEKIEPERGINFKLTHPFLAKIIKKQALTEVSNAEETFHLVLSVENSGMKFYEGQAIGVIPPGKREDGRPLKPMLYSIASSRYGEDGNPNHLALTVKRSVWVGAQNQEIFGVCSDYLCRTQLGDSVPIISPTGRLMLLPKVENADFVFIATGTGIAPIRGYLQYLNHPKTNFQGRVFVYLGFKTEKEALYFNPSNAELKNFQPKFPFHCKIALSREQKNTKGERMYVGDLITQDFPIWENLLHSPNLAFYVCGLKGMEQGINSALEGLSNKINLDWLPRKKALEEENRMNIEVY